MMHSVTLDRDIRTGGAHYRLLVRTDSWEDLTGALDAMDADRLVVVTDQDTPAGLAAAITPDAQHLRIRDAVTLPLVERLAEQALAAGASRRTVVLGLGGGGAVDTAGLLAAMLFQGLRLVQVPTTLAAMCDSALSPWHTVSSGVLGSWYAPELVFCPLDVLRPEEVRAGLVEPIRSVLAICPGHYEEFAAALDASAEYGPRTLASFVALCADARATVTGYDPLERGPGRALEYGRAIGRALRLLTGDALGPGAAEALGLLVAAGTAVRLGLLSRADEHAHRELLRRAGLPVALPADVDASALPSAVRLATSRQGRPGLVLLGALGAPHCTGGTLLTEVDDSTLNAAAEALSPHLGIPHERAEVPEVPAPLAQ